MLRFFELREDIALCDVFSTFGGDGIDASMACIVADNREQVKPSSAV